MFHYSPKEALKRMYRRNSDEVKWSKPDQVIEYKVIRSTAVRNWDGSPAGEGNDPKKFVLQKKSGEKEKTPTISTGGGIKSVFQLE